MPIFKKGPHLGQSVDIWGLGLRVPLKAADPIIQIINGDK